MPGYDLASTEDFHLAALLAHPHLFARIRPWNRVAAALPGYVSIARYLTLFVVNIGIRRPAVHRLHRRTILIPANQHLLVRRAMNAPVGDFRDPAPQLGVQIGEIRRFAT